MKKYILLISPFLLLSLSSCATDASQRQCFGPICEAAENYYLRSQAQLAQEQRRSLALDNQIKEEQLKQLQHENRKGS